MPTALGAFRSVLDGQYRFVETLWRLKGTTDRLVRADIYSCEFGLELRIIRGNEMLRTEMFRGPTARVQLAMRAAELRGALTDKGWGEVLKGGA